MDCRRCGPGDCGKYLAGGFEKAVGLSGIPPAKRYVIVEFDNMDKAKGWYEGGQREHERASAANTPTSASSRWKALANNAEKIGGQPAKRWPWLKTEAHLTAS
jgi:hypothetical protein